MPLQDQAGDFLGLEVYKGEVLLPSSPYCFPKVLPDLAPLIYVGESLKQTDGDNAEG